MREEAVLSVQRILETAHLCSQSGIFPFVIQTLPASGLAAWWSPANGSVRFLLSLSRCLKITKLITWWQPIPQHEKMAQHCVACGTLPPMDTLLVSLLPKYTTFYTADFSYEHWHDRVKEGRGSMAVGYKIQDSRKPCLPPQCTRHLWEAANQNNTTGLGHLRTTWARPQVRV